MDFESKPLEQTKRVCLRLREARENQGVGLDTLSKRMRVSKKHVQHVERCQFERIPFAPIYKKNLVRNYAKALGLDPEPYIEQYTLEEYSDKKSIHTPNLAPKTSLTINIPSIAKTLTLFILICSIFLYIGIQIKHIIEPPNLYLSSPREGQITNGAQIPVRGQTESEVRVLINGNEIKTDEDGNFEENINLQIGVNTLIITAQKKHGKTTNETRHITYRELPKEEKKEDLQN
jgi:hypothetical protein